MASAGYPGLCERKREHEQGKGRNSSAHQQNERQVIGWGMLSDVCGGGGGGVLVVVAAAMVVMAAEGMGRLGLEGVSCSLVVSACQAVLVTLMFVFLFGVGVFEFAARKSHVRLVSSPRGVVSSLVVSVC